jgi:hypothetical protein
MSGLLSRSCGSSVTSSNSLFGIPRPSTDSRATGEDATEETELPDRAEWPLEKKDRAGDEVGSDVITE